MTAAPSAQIFQFPVAPSVRPDWSRQERAEIFRYVEILGRQGVLVEVGSGASDEGDPWFALEDTVTGEVLIHIARIDGEFVVSLFSGEEPRDFAGADLRGLLDEVEARVLAADEATPDMGDREAVTRGVLQLVHVIIGMIGLDYAFSVPPSQAAALATEVTTSGKAEQGPVEDTEEVDAWIEALQALIEDAVAAITSPTLESGAGHEDETQSRAAEADDGKESAGEVLVVPGAIADATFGSVDAAEPAASVAADRAPRSVPSAASAPTREQDGAQANQMGVQKLVGTGGDDVLGADMGFHGAISGGLGDDVIRFSAGGTVTGEQGRDVFVVMVVAGDEPSSDPLALAGRTDFDPASDVLIVESIGKSSTASIGSFHLGIEPPNVPVMDNGSAATGYDAGPGDILLI